MSSPIQSNRLRRGRELAGLSKGQAAKYLGIDKHQLELWELELWENSLEGCPFDLVMMADLYGCDPAWLGGVNDPVPDDHPIRELLKDGRISFEDECKILELFESIGHRPQVKIDS